MKLIKISDKREFKFNREVISNRVINIVYVGIMYYIVLEMMDGKGNYNLKVFD